MVAFVSLVPILQPTLLELITVVQTRAFHHIPAVLVASDKPCNTMDRFREPIYLVVDRDLRQKLR